MGLEELEMGRLEPMALLLTLNETNAAILKLPGATAA